jgi:hypothetical protein
MTLPFIRALVASALLPVLLTVGAGAAAGAEKLDWETGAGKSYVIPALEVGAFIFGLNQFNRHFLDEREYDSGERSFRRNLRTAPVYDADPFSVNQIGHPYQGGMYYGFARSAGLNYWQGLLYTIAGSFLWETAGEITPPSINDHVSTGIGGTFVGEALFRMSSLLLEGGGSTPGFWRELGAAAISPPTGFNRLVFGDRFDAIYPSRDPAIFIRVRLGATLTTDVTNAGIRRGVREQDGSADFYMAYGLPGKPGYQYKRPFDYFVFEFTGVPNADTPQDAVENVTIRGLLAGAKYELGDDYRGLWGLFGAYEYLSPQIFRIATTNVALGTISQWWLTRTMALQGTALLGVGFGAAGTVANEDERDYRYGVIPEAVLGLRLIAADVAMFEAAGRQYHVIGTSSQVGIGTDKFGSELIHRASLGLTVRVYGPHALSVQYVVSGREADTAGRRDRQQSVETVTLSYNFLGHTRFGAVEWRPAEK